MSEERKPIATMVGLLAVALVYSLLRYCVFGEVDWKNAPAYVVNKAVAFGSVLFLMAAGWCYAKGAKVRSRWWGKVSVHSAFVHVALSLSLLGAANYGKFYAEGGELNLSGEVVMLAGACAVYLYWLLAKKQENERRKVALVLGACGLVVVHLVPMGVPGWWSPGGWYGGMPPVSLLSMLAVVAGAVLYKGGANASL